MSSSSSSREGTPLLPTAGASESSGPRVGYLKKVPSNRESITYLISNSWLNVLFVFVPLGTVASLLGWSPKWQFAVNLLALPSLSKLLGDAAFQLRFHQSLGTLTVTVFANPTELVVALAALLEGQFVVVQRFVLGSILLSVLLVLGCAFVLGGILYPESKFNATATQASSSLLTLSCITLIIPSAFEFGGLFGEDRPLANPHVLSRATSVLLFMVYCGFTYFQTKTHEHLFKESNFLTNPEPARMSVKAAIAAWLSLFTAATFCASTVVKTLPQAAKAFHVPENTLAIFFLPLATSLYVCVTSLKSAYKDKMDVSINRCIGNALELSLLVLPVVVILGWISGNPLTLQFSGFDSITIFVAVFLVSLLVSDGKSNYLEGVMLVILYGVIMLVYAVTQGKLV